MKLFLLLFISLLTTATLTAQTPLLASVEYATAPPIKKTKKKQGKKKRFKKPNHSSQTKDKATQTRLIVATSILFGIALLIFLIFFVFGLVSSLTAVILAILIGAALGIASIIMLIVTLIYIARERNKTS